MDKLKGFTLVELIIVIAVIAVLLGMVLIAIDPQKVINDTRDSRARAEMNQIRTALQLYFNDNNSYPTSETALVPDYAKALPGVVTDTNFSFSYSGGGTDYDAGITLNDPNPDDATTVSKCSPPTIGNFMICPD